MEPRFVDTASLREYLLAMASEGVNPHTICDKILTEDLSVLELRVIAETCLSGWAWEQLKRPHNVYAITPDVGEASETVLPTFNDGKSTPRTFVDSQGVRRAGWKQVAFLDDYGRELNRAVKVGNAVTDRKRLAECTVADLTWMARYRRSVAEKNLATAATCMDLAAALTEAGVETVAQLPREVGEKILLR